MANTYALGIHEKNAANTLWLKVDAPDNESLFSTFAVSLSDNLNGFDAFSVADVIVDLKTENGLRVLGLFTDDDYPAADHSAHLFDEGDRSVTIFDKDTGLENVKFPVEKWAARYGVTIYSQGIPVN
jgi:hypothetical protein